MVGKKDMGDRRYSVIQLNEKNLQEVAEDSNDSIEDATPNLKSVERPNSDSSSGPDWDNNSLNKNTSSNNKAFSKGKRPSDNSSSAPKWSSDNNSKKQEKI